MTSATSKTPLLDALRRRCAAGGLELPRFESSPETVERLLLEQVEGGTPIDELAELFITVGELGGLCEKQPMRRRITKPLTH